MSEDSTLLLAGECTTTYRDGDDKRRTRGAVVALVKPDDTVLVHDACSYQPAAWLTRAESVRCTSDEDGFLLTAADGDRALEVVCHDQYAFNRVPATEAGQPVGDCPDCGGSLVRADGVSCLSCDDGFALPRHATVLDETCDCGLPTMRVERGAVLELCIDRSCESMDDAVRQRFDREWTCPNCGGDLRILRRGGLIAGCEQYPDCDTGFAIPTGVVTGTCDCGLPLFDTPSGPRCLDATCDLPSQ